MTYRQLWEFNFRIRKGTIGKKFKKIMKHGRNDVPKSYLKRRLAYVINLISAVNSDGQTLLHSSSKKNYIKLTNFLEKLGCTINVKNSFNKIPPLTALLSNESEVINFVIDANTDFSNHDRELVLKNLVLIKDELDTPSFIAFMRKIKNCSKDLESIADLLVKIKCPLTFVIYAKDALLTQMILQMSDYEIDNEDSIAALQYVIEQSDLENLRVLWQSDRMVKSRNNFLEEKIQRQSTYGPNWKYMRPLFEHLTDWMVPEYDLLLYIGKIFLSANKRNLQVLLQQYNVDVQLRQKYNFHVTSSLFGNEELDIEYLTDLARKTQFNVNGKGFDGMSALHFAVIFDLPMNVRLLLELGADGNVQNDSLCTPLFHAGDGIALKLLLQSGIDMHIACIGGYTALEHSIGGLYSDKSKFMVDQLAIDYYRGVSIRQTIFDEINRNQICKDYFKSGLYQVKKMMDHEMLPYLTLFNIITKRPKKIANQIQSQEIISTIMEFISQQSFRPYYSSFLESNLEQAYNIYRAKCRVATIISKSTSNPFSFDSLVVDAICDCLSYRDMLVVVSV